MITTDTDFTRISIYIPNRFQAQNPLKRLYKLGAVLDYVEHEESKVSKN